MQKGVKYFQHTIFGKHLKSYYKKDSIIEEVYRKKVQKINKMFNLLHNKEIERVLVYDYINKDVKISNSFNELK